MLVPNYLQLTGEQYTQLIQADSDDAVDLVFALLESDTAPVTDIDKDWVELADTLPDGAAQQCLTGPTQLVDDPMLFVSSPEQVAANAPVLAAVELDEDSEALGILQDFYTEAAAKSAAVAVIFN